MHKKIMFFYINMGEILKENNSLLNNVMPCLCMASRLGRKNQVAFTKNIMPTKVRIITHLVTNPKNKAFFFNQITLKKQTKIYVMESHT